MDCMMPLTYVSFSYLSKVNLGRKVVHWTRTLSQDSCSLYEPMYPTHLSPLLLSCPYLFIGLGNWVGGDDISIMKFMMPTCGLEDQLCGRP